MRYPVLFKTLPKALEYGLSTYFENWDHVIQDIYDLNPDVTLLVMGMFDTGVKTEEDAAKNEAALLKFNIAQAIVDFANKPMIESAEKFGYTFVDCTGTTCDDSHPNEAGHRYIADRILEALPDARFPYTDMKFDTADYRTVEAVYNKGIMSGTTATTFSPDEALTKAQLAEALYNIAGTPDVSGISAAFSDVDSSDSKLNAVIWANDRGVLTADKDGNFLPDKEVSKVDFALSLLRSTFADGFNVIDFVKALSLALKVITGNIMSLGSSIARIDAAEKLLALSNI